MLTVDTLRRMQRELGLNDIHLVYIGDDEFVIAHTDEEREKSEPLEYCELHEWLNDQMEQPVRTGFYTVEDFDSMRFVRV